MDAQFTLEMIRQTMQQFEVRYVEPTDASIPVDLSEYTAKMQIRYATSEELYLSFTTEDETGALVIDGPAGKVLVVLDTETMNQIPRGLYRFDIALILDGEVSRAIYAMINVSDNVTDVNDA